MIFQDKMQKLLNFVNKNQDDLNKPIDNKKPI